MRLWFIIALVAGCGEEIEAAKEVAQSCGQQTCPAGTAQRESRGFSGGTDISGGVDPDNYSADGAFARFGKGECEYVCEVINPCPDGTFPVLTTECFTCGTLDAEDNVKQGSCSDL